MIHRKAISILRGYTKNSSPHHLIIEEDEKDGYPKIENLCRVKHDCKIWEQKTYILNNVRATIKQNLIFGTILLTFFKNWEDVHPFPQPSF